MTQELRCPICGKLINPMTEEVEFIKGGICDASGRVYVHTECYRKELHRDKR